MKSFGIPIALATLLTAGLLAVGPIALRAADHAPDSPREPTAESAPGQLPGPDRDATAGGVRSVKSGVEMHVKEGDEHPSSEQSDRSDALLEDLVKQGRWRAETGP